MTLSGCSLFVVRAHFLRIDHKDVTEDLSLAIQVQLNGFTSATNPNGNISSMYHRVCIVSVSYIHSINQLVALHHKIKV